MNPFFMFAAHLNENKNQLAEEILNSALVKMKIEYAFPEWRKERVLKQFRKILELLAEMILEQKDETTGTSNEFLLNWGREVAAQQVQLGEEISIIFQRYPRMRSSFNQVLTKVSDEYNLSVKEHGYVLDQAGLMLDISMQELVAVFERLVKQQRQESQLELAKLSAPIVPVENGIVVIPLIGEIDSYRTKYILETTIPKLAGMNTKHVIADFSGLLSINTETLNLFQQMGSMLRLMGLQVVSTGIRPDLVQAIVKSGIDISGGKSFATVKQALTHIK